MKIQNSIINKIVSYHKNINEIRNNPQMILVLLKYQMNSKINKIKLKNKTMKSSAKLRKIKNN